MSSHKWTRLAVVTLCGLALLGAATSVVPGASAQDAPIPNRAPAPDSAAPGDSPVAAGRSAIYGGGPFYADGQAGMDTLRASGFTTVILWTIHVDRSTGDLIYNDKKIVSGGKYIGRPEWPAELRTLKQEPTSVRRIEIGVGSAGVDDWGSIDDLIDRTGTGPDSILYRNFQALKAATGADAINNDDEGHYDVDSTVAFARMTSGLGYTFAIAPYTNQRFWVAVKNNLGAMVDRVYLQAYAGGTGNDPGSWSRALGMPVDPGLWSRHGGGCQQGDSPDAVNRAMRSWHVSAGIPGGFMWLYDDMKACSAHGSARDYAAAINTGTSD